ncbi:MAG: hypothetical protein ABH842_03275 [Candidatus Micrarchaeota archaeon]
MALNLLGDFFSILTPSLFLSSSILLIIGFIIWEFPRSIKFIDGEYTRGLYPENGRVIDFFFLFWGILSVIYLLVLNNSADVLKFLKTPGITSFYIVIMVTVPLIVIMGYFKRFFERMGKQESITIFFTQEFLDLMHTIFLVSLSILAIPSIGYLISQFL